MKLPEIFYPRRREFRENFLLGDYQLIMRKGCFYLCAVLLGILCDVNTLTQTRSPIQKAEKTEQIENTGCGHSEANFAVLTNYLKNTDNTKGYIIIYEGRLPAKNYQDGILTGTVYILPARDTARRARKNIKERLSAAGIKSNRTVFIKGGSRDYFSVDFWMVPNGAKLPKPTPTDKKIEYRKGKSKQFCS